MKEQREYVALSEPINFGALHEAFVQSGWTYGIEQKRVPSVAELQATVAHLRGNVKRGERVVTGGFMVDRSGVWIHPAISDKLTLVLSWYPKAEVQP